MGAQSSAGNVKEVKSYERCDAGVYPARCIQVVELGSHDVEWQGDVKTKKELLIVWELSELMEDGRPFVVSWRGTNSLNEKSGLYKLLVSWRGKQFEPKELKAFALSAILDKCCMVNISKETNKHTGRDFNKVISVMPLPKGMSCPDRTNDLVDFGIDDLGSPIFEKIYPYVQRIILDSHEGKRFMGTQTSDNYEDKTDEAF